MEKAQVLIVEDDAIIAMDIESQIKQLGYGVTTIVGYGEEAIEKVKENEPDVVLMDIVLKGEMDGIEAAEEIRTQFDIPVVFLTAFANKDRLERAKLTYPFGFIIKPFQNKDLEVTIEMALYVAKVDAERKQTEKFLHESEELHRITLGNISDAVFLTDDTGAFIFICPNVDIIFGYSEEEVRTLDNISKLLGDNYYDPNELEALGEIINIEIEIIDKAGKKHDLLVNVKGVSIKGGTKLITCRDITERNQAEERLLQESTMRTVLLDNLPCVALILKKGTREIVASNQVAKQFGAVQGKTCYETCAQRDDNCPFCLAPKLWATGDPQRLEVEYEGTYYEGIWVPLTEELYVHYIFDITDRKKAEKSLQESEKRYRTIFEQAADSIVIVDPNTGMLVEFNDKAYENLGYTPQEFKKIKLFEYEVHESEAEVIKHLAKVLKEGSDTFETQHRTKDGQIRDISVSCRVISIQEKDFVHSIWRDITNSKQAEEALRESEEKYRLLVNNIPSIVYKGYKDWSVDFFDEKIELLTGYDADEFNSKRMKWNDIIVKEEIETARESFIQALKADKTYIREYRIKSKAGDLHWIQERGQIVCDSKGEIEYVSGVFFDINERKQLEAQLLQAQKMESIGTLAGGIAHDFNNILFPMMGYAEMMLDDLPADNPHRNNTNEILQGAKRASDLVKQILTFSRLSVKELKPLKIQLIIKEVLKLIRSSLPSTIEIKRYISNECGLVMADSAQVHQIAMNLMTNAYQVMEDEGGVLEVTLKEVELGADDLTDPSMPPGTYVCLTVADTGPGMDQSVLDRIFDPYFTTKENGKGTGLGLAVVHGIVKSYKGDVKVYSEPGEGTAFHVYLPVIKSQVETEETEAVTPVQKGTERILLVDDEEPIVHMEKQMLERLGYDVTERTSSIEALEAFRASPDKFDLVITDMTMPNMTGIQLSQKLLEIRPDIPIIICTGFSTKIDDEKAKAAGIRGYVMKPIVMSEIANKIREVLDQD